MAQSGMGVVDPKKWKRWDAQPRREYETKYTPEINYMR